MSVDRRKANPSRRESLRRYVIAQGRRCWICGCPIDYRLPAGNPECCEIDELVPVSLGGDPYSRSNCVATHRCCNNWRSTRSVADVQQMQQRLMLDGWRWRTPSEFVACAKAADRAYIAAYYRTFTR